MSEEIAVADVSTPAPVEAPAVEAPVEKSMDDTLAAEFERIKAARPTQGEDGKFIPKAGADPATPKVDVPGKSEGVAPELVQPAIEPPISLPADVKAKWSTLPPDVQQVWAKRESEIHEKITTDGQRLKSLSAFDEVLAEHKEFLAQQNVPGPEYVRRLAAADKLLRSDGPSGVRQILQMYGIDPRTVFQPMGQPQGQPMDPQVNALAQELSAIKSQLTAQERAAETARLAEAEKKVEAFKKDRPHFDKVEALMTKLYEPGMELDALYDMATKAHPEVSKLIQAEQETKAKAEALEKQKAEAAAAAKLATQSRKPGSVGVIAKAGGSWEDSMAATFRGIRARG